MSTNTFKTRKELERLLLRLNKEEKRYAEFQKRRQYQALSDIIKDHLARLRETRTTLAQCLDELRQS